MTAPNPPPRGGAEPHVSAETNCPLCDGSAEVSIAPFGDLSKQDHYGCPLCMSEDFAEERADLRAKLEAAEAERDEAREEADEAKQELWPKWAETCLKAIRKRSGYDGYDGYDDASEGVDLPQELEELLEDWNRLAARADAAEAALREMTEQRDGAWEAGALAMRDAATQAVATMPVSVLVMWDRPGGPPGNSWRATTFADAAAVVRVLAPPAETAAKEERTRWRIEISEREDGGLRVMSPDIPGLLLSHSNRAAVVSDISPALLVMLGLADPSPNAGGGGAG